MINKRFYIVISGILFFCLSFTTRIVKADSLSYLSLTSFGTTSTSVTYSSPPYNVSGTTRYRGMIITDGVAAPTAIINQGLVDSTTWQATHTVTFVQSGALWQGKIDTDVFGKYAKLIVSNMGNATILTVNWFASAETAVSTTLSTIVTGSITATNISSSTGTNTAVTVATATATLIAANVNRGYVAVLNEGTTNDLYISFFTPASTATAYLVPKSNGTWVSDFSGHIYTGAIYGITNSGTTLVKVLEHN